MRQMIRQHGRLTYSAIFIGIAALSLVGFSAFAQVPRKPTDPNQKSVSLIAQDFSDCTNTTVKDDPDRTRGGEIWVTRESNGTMHVEVAMTVNPNTSYQFFLKCVHLLGNIQTDEDGTGMASFDFPASLVGPKFAFDMYPEGAPAGNKFQSLTVSFP